MRWLNAKNHPVTTSSGVRRSLEDRVILCVDCDANRTLSVSASGNLVCSSCGSDNWMHLPTTIIVKQSVSIIGELIVEEDLTIEGRVEGRIELKVIISGSVLTGKSTLKSMPKCHYRGKREGEDLCQRHGRNQIFRIGAG